LVGDAPQIVVLIKEPGTAKTRLAGTLSGAERRRLAEECASRALTAAQRVAPTLAVCGGPGAARLARAAGVEVLMERRPEGQIRAAERGLAAVTARGGTSCLLLSSDLPLVDADSLRRLLGRAEAIAGAVVVAAPARGRQGTNGLYLRPIGEFDLQFGDASLPRFAAEARRRGRAFVVHEEPALSLDVDEPDDLATLDRWRAAGSEAP
jgi:2-phospho-L-lactate guanylyltransferase